MKTVSRYAAVLCLLLFAAGCGQKGPLFLPDDPNAARSEIPGQEPEDDTAEEREGNDRQTTDQSSR